MNIRPATHEDDGFLREMLYEAAAWNPDWPRERTIATLADPVLERYHRDWGRPGDAGVIAELERTPVRAAWYRLFTEEEPGHGFVDEKTPSSGSPWSRCIGARGSARRFSGRSWCRRARKASRRCRCRSPSTTGRG